MKKFISLVLALVMALSLTTIAWGADPAAKIGDTPYDSLELALQNVHEGETINVYDAAVLNGTYALPANVKIVGMGENRVVVNGGPVFEATNISVTNISFEEATRSSFGIVGSGTFVNCKFFGASGLNNSSADIGGLTFTNCDFYGATYALNIGGSGEVKVENSTVKGYTSLWGSGLATIKDSEFVEAENPNNSVLDFWNNAVIEGTSFDEKMTIDSRKTGKTLTISDCTVTDGSDIKDLIYVKAVTDNAVTLDGALLAVAKDANGNDIIGAGVTTDASGKVNGGTFASVPANVADGYEALLTNGAYMVVPKTSAAGTTTTLKDADKYDIYAVAGTTSVKAAKADITKKVTDKTTVTVGDKTTVTYTATTYSDDVNVYVEVDASIATYKLMQGNTIVAYMVNLADVGYVPTTTKVATAFVEAKKAADQVCGDNTVDGYVIDGKTYVAGGANWAVLNGKFVSYTDTVVAKVPHTYADATYSAKDKSVTSVKCTACKVTWNVLTAKQVAVMAPASYTTATTASGTYFIPAAVVSAGATDTKVESAQTFDAGIAMYVGMSVMAAAGSAVVLKKKD